MTAHTRTPRGRQRADQLVVERGLAATRQRAQALIMAGQIVRPGPDGQPEPIAKAGQLLPEGCELALRGTPSPYVSRGGHKLEAALRAWAVPVAGARVLDVGASTGGFTDCLLQHGAAHVIALDVGHAQLHPRLRADPRVTVLEHANIRLLARTGPGAALDPGRGDMARDLAPGPPSCAPPLSPPGLTIAPALLPVDGITIDVSFIGLRLALPPALTWLRPGGWVVALVKPQFEAERHEVGRGGVIRQEGLRAAIVERACSRLGRMGLSLQGQIDCPIFGLKQGNREVLVYACLAPPEA